MSMARNETLILALSNLESSMGVDRLTFPKRSKAVEKKYAKRHSLIIQSSTSVDLTRTRSSSRSLPRSTTLSLASEALIKQILRLLGPGPSKGEYLNGCTLLAADEPPHAPFQLASSLPPSHTQKACRTSSLKYGLTSSFS
jgi:hypothetical protein